MKSEKNSPLGDEIEDEEFGRSSRPGRGRQEQAGRSGGTRKQRSQRRSYTSGKGGVYATRLANPNYVRQIGSKVPQAVAVVCSYGHGKGVKNLLTYVGRVGKNKEIELEDEMGRSYSGQERLDQLYDNWSTYFDEGKSYTTKQGQISRSRHAAHIILSASCELTDHNVNLVVQAARDTARTVFMDNGYDYAIGLHQDSKHPHAHLIVRCNPKAKGLHNKLRLNPNDLFKLRTVFAQNLSEWGLEHKATLRADEPECIHDFLAGKTARLKSKKDNWYKHALQNVHEQVDLLEKADKQFGKAHKAAVSAKQKYDYLQKVKKALELIRTDIREKTVPKSKERLDSMSLVRSFERKLAKRYFDKSKVREGFLGLMKGMNEQLQIYDASSSSDEKLKAINSFFGKHKKRSPAEIKQEKLERIFESIEAAKKIIRKRKDMSRPERKELRKMLADFEKQVVKMGKAVGLKRSGRWA